MKLSEAVQEIIRLGDLSRAYWDRELPRHHPHYPLIRDGENPVPPPPEDSRIQALLEGLPEDQLYALLLLAYVGRGDYRADELLPAYRAMKETFFSKDLAIAQMMGERTLAEYLTDAMEELQKRRIDLDRIEFDRPVPVS